MPGATVITGVSSGLGLETAIYLAQRGFTVAGTMRNPAKRAEFDAATAKAGVSIDLVPLDVQDRSSIESAVASIRGKHGAIENLVNNAGVQIRGYFEDLSDVEIRGVFDTNVFGAMAVTRAVLPFMREAKRGRVVFLSSVGGLVGSLGLSAYCSSKFALEGFAESLALEMALFGIGVSLVEPGIIKTAIWNSNLQVAAKAKDESSPNRAYFAESERLAGWAVESSPIRSIHVAEVVHRALTARSPRLRYLVGSRPAAFLAARKLLPAALFERVYHRALTNKVKRASSGN